jgi:2-amino-4-hydroxy-6-hydroxymethyldihydropteridine diphosphokinase
VALAYVGLGANLGEPARTLEAAIDRLGEIGTVERRSRLYRSAPWGVRDQPDFVNAAARLETQLQPSELLVALKSLEREFGRTEGPRYGPRILDLDLLTYDDLCCDDGNLTLPHPQLFERAFVLVPLAEIDPAFEPALAALPGEERAEVVPLAEWKGPSVLWDEVKRRVREVVATCIAGDLTRLAVNQDGLEVEVVRKGRRRIVVEPHVLGAVPGETVSSPNGAVAEEDAAELLRSDVVGIVHFSHPPIAEGAILGEEREVAYVESLGIRNPVSSRGPGRVVRVLVSDGQAVDYAQPLFAIERT